MTAKRSRDANGYDRLSLALQLIQVFPVVAAGGMVILPEPALTYPLTVVLLLAATGLALGGIRIRRRGRTDEQ